MVFLIYILFVIYITSIVLLGIRYGEKEITPNLWSILSLVVPVLNTVLFMMLTSKENRKENRNLKKFINEIKNKKNI